MLATNVPTVTSKYVTNALSLTQARYPAINREVSRLAYLRMMKKIAGREYAPVKDDEGTLLLFLAEVHNVVAERL